jgi:dolichol-phosphate mannosyltransferase
VTFSGNPKLSVIAPTYKEAPNIPILIGEIVAALGSVIPEWELFIIDDNSNDGTFEECERLRRQGVPLELVVRKDKRGLASAVIEGFTRARAPVLVVMDADLSHPPTTIPLLYQTIQDGVEFAIGSRYIPGGSTDDKWTVYRFINSKIATLLAMPLIPVKDPMSGFFAISRTFWKRCRNLSPVGYKIGLEMFVKGKPVNFKEIPFHFRSRKFGKSKLTIEQQLLYLRHLCSLYSYQWKAGRK